MFFCDLQQLVLEFGITFDRQRANHFEFIEVSSAGKGPEKNGFWYIAHDPVMCYHPLETNNARLTVRTDLTGQEMGSL